MLSELNHSVSFISIFCNTTHQFQIFTYFQLLIGHSNFIKTGTLICASIYCINKLFSKQVMRLCIVLVDYWDYRVSVLVFFLHFELLELSADIFDRLICITELSFLFILDEAPTYQNSIVFLFWYCTCWMNWMESWTDYVYPHWTKWLKVQILYKISALISSKITLEPSEWPQPAFKCAQSRIACYCI